MRVLLPLLVLALLPLASAQGGDPLCIIFVEPEEDFSVIRMRADLILGPEERGNVSAAVDADGDGTLTQAEVAAYEATREESFTAVADMGERILFLDGKSPKELLVRVKLSNWTGPVETARNGTVTEHREYRMGTVPYDYQHAVSGGLGAHPYAIPKPVVEVVIVNAPEGWLVTSVSQQGNGSATTSPSYASGNLFSGSQRSVRLDGFDLHSSYLMTFSDATPTYPKGTPGPGALLVLAGVTLAALAWRRARRAP